MFLKAEPGKYAIAVEWINLLLKNTKLDVERVKITACKMENSISEMKRSGSLLSKTLLNSIVYDANHVSNFTRFIQQQGFLKDIIKKLENEKEAVEVLTELEKLKDNLKNPDNLSLHISTDADNIKKFSDIAAPWNKYFSSKSSPVANVNPESFKMAFRVKETALPHVLYPMGSCESSFLVRCTPAIQDPRYSFILIFLSTFSNNNLYQDIF